MSNQSKTQNHKSKIQTPLGVLIHGAGWVSTQHIAAFAANPNTEVVAISSRTVKGARQRAAEFGLDVPCFEDYAAALAQPGVDIISICTPQHLHAEHVIAAADAGKHVVIEKPAAQSMAELHAMQAAISRAGVKSVVSFVLRWNPMFVKLKQMSAAGDFGEIFCVETDYQSYSGDWWGGFSLGRTLAKGGSAMLVAGCHAIDALRWFAAQGEFEAADPIEIFAYEGGKRGRSTTQYNPVTNSWHEGEPLEYAGVEMILVKFSNGVLGKVGVNFECIQPYRFPVQIFGDQGSAKDNKIWSHRYPEQRDWIEFDTIRPDSADVSHHPFQGEIDHFVNCIQNNVESHCNLADAIKTHAIVFAAQECYRTGRPVGL
ncbi:MAG: Gfo/Idh/MocA family oxidoreductase [Kiritimatiellae bacterium]|nr:Gfo/Idh/MocA family oxidoreductase [Kiritimatiellia bacterium]